MGKWRGENNCAGTEGYSGGCFSFRMLDDSQINVTTTAEGIGFAGQPFAYSVTVVC